MTDELVVAVVMIGTLWPQQVRQGLLGGFPDGGSSDTPWAGLREAGCVGMLTLCLSEDRQTA